MLGFWQMSQRVHWRHFWLIMGVTSLIALWRMPRKVLASENASGEFGRGTTWNGAAFGREFRRRFAPNPIGDLPVRHWPQTHGGCTEKGRFSLCNLCVSVANVRLTPPTRQLA